MAYINTCPEATLDDRRFRQEVLLALSAISQGQDAEYLTYYDLQSDGSAVPFIRIISTDTDGNPTVTDVTADGTTPYVVTGTAKFSATTAVRPAPTAIVITPNDGANLSSVVDYIITPGAGSITVDLEDGTTVTETFSVAGQYYWARIKKVYVTGTTGSFAAGTFNGYISNI